MTKKLSEEELKQMLIDARKLVEINGYYNHYKGNLYQVLDVAILTEEIGVGVIYQAQYGESIVFVRPLEIWLEEVEYGGNRTRRFIEA